MNNKTIALLLILALLLVGCDKAKDITSKNPSIEGSEGIQFEFYRNTPAKEVFELQSLPLALHLSNVGACDLHIIDDDTNPNRCTVEGKVLLSLAWDNRRITIPWNDKAEELRQNAGDDDLADGIRYLAKKGDKTDTPGKPAFALYLYGRDTIPGPSGSSSVTEGEERLFILEAQAWGINLLNTEKDFIKTQITAGLCYPYKTQLSTNVCIDSDLFNLQDKEKTCEVILEQDLKTQGAPVAITHMKTDMLPSNVHSTIPRFEFTIQNVGKGKVLAKEARHKACAFEPLDPQKDLNKITFSASLPGQKLDLFCNITDKKKKEIVVELDKDTKQATVICETLPIHQSKGSFDTPLLVELEYDYFDEQTEEIKINRVRRLARS
jgi:hypothetical protein